MMIVTTRELEVMSSLEKNLSEDNWCKGVLAQDGKLCLLGHFYYHGGISVNVIEWIERNININGINKVPRFNDSCDNVEQVRELIRKTIADMRENNDNKKAIASLDESIKKIKEKWGKDPEINLRDYLEMGHRHFESVRAAISKKLGALTFIGNVYPTTHTKEQVVEVLEEAKSMLNI